MASSEDEALQFALNERFSSYEELSAKVSAVESSQGFQTNKSSSRTILNWRKRAPKKNFNENLQYACIDYECVHSGVYKSKSTGIRPDQS
jgi:hypothetical protein